MWALIIVCSYKHRGCAKDVFNLKGIKWKPRQDESTMFANNKNPRNDWHAQMWFQLIAITVFTWVFHQPEVAIGVVDGKPAGTNIDHILNTNYRLLKVQIICNFNFISLLIVVKLIASQKFVVFIGCTYATVFINYILTHYPIQLKYYPSRQS